MLYSSFWSVASHPPVNLRSRVARKRNRNRAEACYRFDRNDITYRQSVKHTMMTACPSACLTARRCCSPIKIESLEDGVDDSIYGLHVDKTEHRPSMAADFQIARLAGVGGAPLALQVFGENEEGQQFGQAALQLPHNRAIVCVPFLAESPRRGRGLGVFGQGNDLGVRRRPPASARPAARRTFCVLSATCNGATAGIREDENHHTTKETACRSSFKAPRACPASVSQPTCALYSLPPALSWATLDAGSFIPLCKAGMADRHTTN